MRKKRHENHIRKSTGMWPKENKHIYQKPKFPIYNLIE